MKYNLTVVLAYWKTFGIPTPVPEHMFAESIGRRWRFDFSWPDFGLACEVQGGIFVAGRHSRGAAMLKEWEKLNHAAQYGYRIIYCQPKDVTTKQFAELILRALKPTQP